MIPVEEKLKKGKLFRFVMPGARIFLFAEPVILRDPEGKANSVGHIDHDTTFLVLDWKQERDGNETYLWIWCVIGERVGWFSVRFNQYSWDVVEEATES